MGLCILIATKDRVCKLSELLDSISKSTLKPELVVIVYAGTDVSEVVKKFNSRLSMQVLQSEIASQVTQKKLGLDHIKDSFEWVLFLDDDLILEKTTLANLEKKYLANPLYQKYSGFGLAIRNRKHRVYNPFVTFILWAFQLYSFKPGKITKSGHPQTYLDNQTPIDVDWLNGASIWKSEVLNFYGENQKAHIYSAYEDVIFSYKVRGSSFLLYAHDCFIYEQDQKEDLALTYQQFLYGSFLRYYFVDSHKEFSKFLLLVSQILRGIDYVSRSKEEGRLIQRIKQSCVIWFNIFFSALSNNDSSVLLEKKLQVITKNYFNLPRRL